VGIKPTLPEGTVLSDRSQGSAHPLGCAIPVHHVSETESDVFVQTRSYCGSTPLRPRRGRATTRGQRIFAIVARAHPHAATTKVLELLAKRDDIALDIGRNAYAGVPTWNRDEHWVTWAIPIAYAQRYDKIRHLIGAHGNSRKDDISLRALTKIAAAHAVYADYRTGRNCRPSVDLIAEITGYKRRTVSRARQVLVQLGVATEVLRGRQRTLSERLASHRVGDRSRGWASVYALHSCQVVDKRAGHTSAAPHPEGRPLGRQALPSNYSLTPTGDAGKSKGHASRDPARDRKRWRGPNPDREGMLLASKWRQSPRTPGWAREYTPAAWSHVLAKPAAHGWTARDLNQLLTDHVGLGGWIAARPQKPIKLLAFILGRHGNLEDRPAAADDARELEKQAHWSAIAECARCDHNGFVEAGDRVRRCTH
jgi:hypothetical protein